MSLWLGEPWVWHWSAFGWFSMVLQTLVGAFASYLTWMWLLSHYPAMRISVFVFLTPVFALVFGAIWLREVISLHVGQCGNQIGSEFWKRVSVQRHL